MPRAPWMAQERLAARDGYGSCCPDRPPAQSFSIQLAFFLPSAVFLLSPDFLPPLDFPPVRRAVSSAMATACFCGFPSCLISRMFSEIVFFDFPDFKGMHLTSPPGSIPGTSPVFHTNLTLRSMRNKLPSLGKSASNYDTFHASKDY